MIICIRDSKEDNQKFIDRFGEERFAKFQRLKPNFEVPKRDLYYWLDKTREELEKEFNETILKGNEAIGENEQWLVVQIENKDQIRQLAGDMPWCIKQGDEFEVSVENGVDWFLFLDKNNRHNKIMAARRGGSYEITDNENHRIAEIPNAPEGFDFKSSITDNSFVEVLRFIINGNTNEQLVYKFGDFFGDLDVNNPYLKEYLMEQIEHANLNELANYIDSNIRRFV